MKKVAILLLLSLSFVLTSCFTNQRLVDFTLLSAKNHGVKTKLSNTPRVVGVSIYSVKDAIDKALESAGLGYDALIDGVVYRYSGGFKVEGTPIKTSDLAQLIKDGVIDKDASVFYTSDEKEK